MMKSTARNIPYLDGWRGLAIALVLQAHFLFGGGGRLGVALFFVLSGYLMGNLLFNKEVPIQVFFARRFSRVIPTFWLYVTVVLVYAQWFQPRVYDVSLAELAATLTFLRTYFPANLNIWADKWPIGHLWSLNVEEHSYVFLAALAVLVRKFGSRRAMVGYLFFSTGVILAISVWYALHPPGGASPWFTRSECASLGLVFSSAIAAWRHGTSNRLVREGHPAIALVALAIAVACYGLLGDSELVVALAPLLLAVAVNYIDCAPLLVRQLLSMRVLRWFGACSFSLYIWQQPFFLAYTEAGANRQLCGLLALATGCAFFYLFEDPSRRFLNRWFDNRRAKRGKTAAPPFAAAPVKADN